MGATGDITINCRCAVRYIKPEVSQPSRLDQHGTEATTSAPSPIVATPA